MSRFATLLGLALLGATACGRAPVASSPQSLADGVPDASGILSTGVGSRIETYLYRNGAKPGLLYVWYYDTQRYFGDYAPLKLVLRLHTAAGITTRTETLNTYGGDGEGAVSSQHITTVPIAANTRLDAVEIAVANAAGNRWDSNYGKNYVIALKAR